MSKQFSLQPDTEFSKRLKATYFSEFKKRYPTMLRVPRAPFSLLARGAVVALAIMVVTGSTAVYADQTNVGAKSALYPLKRSYEAARVILASKTEKPALQAYLATRRLDEIKTIKAENPIDPQISDLKRDLNDAIERSAQNIEVEDNSQGVTEMPEIVTSGKNRVLIVVTSTMNRSDQEEVNNDQGDNQDNENDSEVSSGVAASLPPVVMREKQRGGRADKSEFSGKNKSLCEAWDHVFGNDDEDARDSIPNYDSLLQKFERTCL